MLKVKLTLSSIHSTYHILSRAQAFLIFISGVTAPRVSPLMDNRMSWKSADGGYCQLLDNSELRPPTAQPIQLNNSGCQSSVTICQGTVAAQPLNLSESTDHSATRTGPAPRFQPAPFNQQEVRPSSQAVPPYQPPTDPGAAYSLPQTGYPPVAQAQLYLSGSQSAAHYPQLTPMVAPPTAPGYISPYNNPATLTMTEIAMVFRSPSCLFSVLDGRVISSC